MFDHESASASPFRVAHVEIVHWGDMQMLWCRYIEIVVLVDLEVDLFHGFFVIAQTRPVLDLPLVNLIQVCWCGPQEICVNFLGRVLEADDVNKAALFLLIFLM